MKLLRWVSKLALIVLLVSGLSITTTFVLFQWYADQLLKQFNITANFPQLSLADMLAQFAGQGNTIEEERIDEHTEKLQNTSPMQETDMDAQEVWNQDAEAFNEEEQLEDLIMSVEDFKQKRELLSNEDKMKIFSLFMAKIPQEELQKLSHLMEEGVTKKELQEIENMIQVYFNEEEYRELIGIIGKYE